MGLQIPRIIGSDCKSDPAKDRVQLLEKQDNSDLRQTVQNGGLAANGEISVRLPATSKKSTPEISLSR